jgi:hypothetical protein
MPLKAKLVRTRTVKLVLVLAAGIILISPPCRLWGGTDAAASPILSPPEQDAQGDQNLKELVNLLLRGNASDRQRTAIALGHSKNARAVEPLVKALNDEDDFVRNFAAKALGDLGDGRAFEPLVKAMTDRNLLVRRSAVLALGGLGDPRAFEPLVKVLEGEDFMLQRSAAKALGELKDARAVDALLGVLASNDSYVRDGAVVALTQIGSPSIPKLVSRLSDWTLGPRVAGILKDLNWQPSSDQEEVLFNAAMRNRQFLLDNWETAQKVLLNDANSGNNGPALNAVFVLISLGRDDVAAELAGILERKGSIEMAAAFLNCGNDYLVKASRTWVLKNKADLKNLDSMPIVAWAGMK